MLTLNPADDTVSSRASQRHFITAGAGVLRVELAGPAGAETLLVTGEHPILRTDGTWVDAIDLTAGDELAGGMGRVSVVSVVELRERMRVYNLSIADTHTYAVGVNQLWVHNACPGHHPIPKFLGGNEKQELARIDQVVHNEFHSELRQELRAVGLDRPIGGTTGSRDLWLDGFQRNPGLQDQAMGAVYRASATIDAKYGTNLVGSFLSNLTNGNFVRIP
jgi:hypothetical protein